ncbi:MAG: radical SAM protein [Phycisphaerales bacterium]|nr:radical SAM protein [Phycisphaerales bacterium]
METLLPNTWDGNPNTRRLRLGVSKEQQSEDNEDEGTLEAMRVLLIQPPYDLFDDDPRQAMPPLGLAYIAAVLERSGHEVKIIDCVAEDFDRLTPMPDGRRRHGLDGADLIRAVAAFDPRVVGVSCLFSAQAPAAHQVCAQLKQLDTQIITIMGGAHPSAAPESVLADPFVDYVVLGEGEQTMLELVQALDAGCPLPNDPAGLAWRQDGVVTVRSRGVYWPELDTLPLPARHLLPMARYFEYRAPHGGRVKRHPCTNMITSRGCPARCSFCSIHTVWGRRYRAHSAARVIEEIEHLMTRYDVREIQFEDDNLTLHKTRFVEICQTLIERRIDLTWTTPNGVAMWALDEQMLELMRRAGCHHIALAVESGVPRVLGQIIKKPLDLARVPSLIKACRRLGMGVSVFFVVGFPGETKDEIRQTIDYAINLEADQVNFFTATPYPGTELYRQCVDERLIAMPIDYTTLRVGRPVISTPDWTSDELAELVRAAQARFYRRVLTRRPLHFVSLALNHFVREPVATMRKLRNTFLPRLIEAAPGPEY